MSANYILIAAFCPCCERRIDVELDADDEGMPVGELGECDECGTELDEVRWDYEEPVYIAALDI